MGERGPRPSIVQALEPAVRVRMDVDIVAGRLSKKDLHRKYAEPVSVGYKAFCEYAARLEERAGAFYMAAIMGTVFGVGLDTTEKRAHRLVNQMFECVLSGVRSGTLASADLDRLTETYELLKHGKLPEAENRFASTDAPSRED